jgi:hypothetical protein
MYSNDSRTGYSMTSCPICYCTVDEKFMSMHIMWHDETDVKEEEQYIAQPVPINQVEYDL